MGFQPLWEQVPLGFGLPDCAFDGRETLDAALPELLNEAIDRSRKKSPAGEISVGWHIVVTPGIRPSPDRKMVCYYVYDRGYCICYKDCKD